MLLSAEGGELPIQTYRRCAAGKLRNKRDGDQMNREREGGGSYLDMEWAALDAWGTSAGQASILNKIKAPG